MSHIPSSAMPHAQANDDENSAGTPPEGGEQAQQPKEEGGTVQAATEQVRDMAQAATDRAGAAASAATEAATSAATQASEAAKGAANKINGLPTLVKVLGAAAVVGGIAAAAVLPFLQEPEDTGRAKRKKNKAKKA